MPLSNLQAEQIAALLNERNQLTVPSTAQSVLAHIENYIYRTSLAGDVLACVEVKKVQWYQAEVLHLTVRVGQEGKGHAKALLAEAERSAAARKARLLQCTIREGNAPSTNLFLSVGFVKVGSFHNHVSGNNVLVLQKILTSAA